VMNDRRVRLFPAIVLLCLAVLSAVPLFAAMKNWAVIAPSGSKLQEVTLADLSKLCKGTQKTWPDGKNFTVVMHDPESADMRVVVQKLFGVSPAEVKPLVAKLNESRPVVKIVENDEDLLRTVDATPGAIGLVDVYAINSSVKVLRIDGKLPFDAGYTLKGN
jgi:ABC-type phosphate transport system substrate-binding protein